MSFSLFLNFCIFLIGASVGSFINMAAYRIPLRLSIIRPRSYCNHCKTVLSFFALIPVFGYFFSAGKCRKCKIRIPLEYPLIEMLSGIFFVFAAYYYDAIFAFQYSSAIYLKSNLFVQLMSVLWLFTTGLLLSVIDFKHRILPDVIIIPGILLNLVLGSLNPDLGFIQSILGIFVGGLGLWSVAQLYALVRKKEGMGFGDVKYLAFLGGLLGWKGVIFTLFLASVLGSVIGIPYLFFQKKNLHTPIPFGPFLAFSGVIYFLLSKNFAII